MPIISMFYGIIIKMFSDDHNPPHFHAEYQGYRAVISLDGDCLAGNLPQPQKRMIDAWLEIHRDELMANWKISKEKGQMFKIEPLK